MRSLIRRCTASSLVVSCLSFGLFACKKSGQSTSSQTSTGQPSPNSSSSQPVPQTAATFSVDDLVAPIALYPDTLLAQILAASTNPQEVLDAGNWLLQNQNLQGEQLNNAAKQAGFGPSVQYLVNFPQVVDSMCQQMDWTRQLGQAFTQDQTAVMNAVQKKRGEAKQVGNLQSTPQQTVETKTESGKEYVTIEPSNPEVVYVPQYDPQVVYTTPPSAAPATTTATTTTSSGVSTGAAVATSLLSFGIGMAIGSAMHHDDYYYPAPAWGYGRVYYGGRPFYPAAMPYRPAYTSAWRPAYAYRPPANYRWNNANINRNLYVNNQNYYNRFRTTTPATRPVTAGNQPVQNYQNRPVGQGAQNYRGQSTYAGAAQRPVDRSASTAAVQNRRENLAASNAAANRTPGTAANNYAANRANATSARTQRAETRAQTGDRGYGGSLEARNVTPPAPAARPSAASTSAPTRADEGAGRAFSSNGSERSEKTASTRGRQSLSANQGTSGSRRRNK
jgi:Protein of unknown function (DUF3300)